MQLSIELKISTASGRGDGFGICFDAYKVYLVVQLPSSMVCWCDGRSAQRFIWPAWIRSESELDLVGSFTFVGLARSFGIAYLPARSACPFI